MRAPVQAAFDALRCGRASSDDWSLLAACLWMARSIEKQGVVRGLAEYLNRADHVLAAIEARAAGHVPAGGDACAMWRAPTLYAPEIEAIDTFVELHFFQLAQLSYGEFARARKLTEGQMKTKGRHIQKLSEIPT